MIHRNESARRRFIRLGLIGVALTVLPFYAVSGELEHRPNDQKVWPKNLIRMVQEKLNEAGFDSGIADGVVGPNTRRAIRAFQKNNGLSESGEINKALLKELDLDQ